MISLPLYPVCRFLLPRSHPLHPRQPTSTFWSARSWTSAAARSSCSKLPQHSSSQRILWAVSDRLEVDIPIQLMAGRCLKINHKLDLCLYKVQASHGECWEFSTKSFAELTCVIHFHQHVTEDFEVLNTARAECDQQFKRSCGSERRRAHRNRLIWRQISFRRLPALNDYLAGWEDEILDHFLCKNMKTTTMRPREIETLIQIPKTEQNFRQFLSLAMTSFKTLHTLIWHCTVTIRRKAGTNQPWWDCCLLSRNQCGTFSPVAGMWATLSWLPNDPPEELPLRELRLYSKRFPEMTHDPLQHSTKVLVSEQKAIVTKLRSWM